MIREEYNIELLSIKDFRKRFFARYLVDYYYENNLMEIFVDKVNNKEWKDKSVIIKELLANDKYLGYVNKINQDYVSDLRTIKEVDNFLKLGNLRYKSFHCGMNQLVSSIRREDFFRFNKLMALSELDILAKIKITLTLRERGYKLRAYWFFLSKISKEELEDFYKKQSSSSLFSIYDLEIIYNSLLYSNDYFLYKRISSYIYNKKLREFVVSERVQENESILPSKIFNKYKKEILECVKEFKKDFDFDLLKEDSYIIPKYNLEKFPKRLRVKIKEYLITCNQFIPRQKRNENEGNQYKLINRISELIDFMPKVNIDLICDRLDDIIISIKNGNQTYADGYIDLNTPLSKECLSYLDFYNEKRKLSLLLPATRILSYYSTSGAYEKYVYLKEQGYNDNDIFIKKPRRLSEVNNRMDYLFNKEKQEDYPLDQKSVAFLENKTVDIYTLKLPKTSHELIDVGDRLNICVGNETYARKVKNKKSNIVLLLVNEEIVGCVEFIGDHILQAMGVANAPITFRFTSEIKKKLNNK